MDASPSSMEMGDVEELRRDPSIPPYAQTIINVLLRREAESRVEAAGLRIRLNKIEEHMERLMSLLNPPSSSSSMEGPPTAVAHVMRPRGRPTKYFLDLCLDPATSSSIPVLHQTTQPLPNSPPFPPPPSTEMAIKEEPLQAIEEEELPGSSYDCSPDGVAGLQTAKDDCNGINWSSLNEPNGILDEVAHLMEGVEDTEDNEKEEGKMKKNPGKKKKRFICTYPDCFMNFFSASALQGHRAAHDAGEASTLADKPYACDQCGRMFACANYLYKHVKTHSDLRRFECPLCDKKFRRSDHRKAHLDSVHGK